MASSPSSTRLSDPDHKLICIGEDQRHDCRSNHYVSCRMESTCRLDLFYHWQQRSRTWDSSKLFYLSNRIALISLPA